MDTTQFDNYLLEEKKRAFLSAVNRAAKKFGLDTPPEVRFWDSRCPSDNGNELAHIHPELKIICVAIPRLKTWSNDDIERTATHEVTHLIELNHSDRFYKLHDEIRKATWLPPSGVTIVDGTKKRGKPK